jgi:RNA ligase (TIGR02306 family)
MSSFSCPVVRLTAVEPHPNADRLELAQVLGWRAVVQKGLHQAGDLVVYIPTEAVLPPGVLERFGFTGKLAGKEKNRVKTVKLRGEISQGLVLPLREVVNFTVNLEHSAPALREPAAWEGEDVSDLLGIVKYEPPIPVHMAGEVEPAPEWFRLHYDVENLKNWPDVFREAEPVVVTEKIHGTNCRVGYHREDGFFVGSRNKERALLYNATNLYWRAAEQAGLRDKLHQYVEDEGLLFVVVFGEVHGAGVQDLHYGHQPGEIGFRAFDLLFGRMDGSAEYLRAAVFHPTMYLLGIPAVPLLYVGPYNADAVSLLTDGPDFSGSHIREGIVIKPAEERYDAKLGRVLLKSVSTKYLLREGGTEYH